MPWFSRPAYALLTFISKWTWRQGHIISKPYTCGSSRKTILTGAGWTHGIVFLMWQWRVWQNNSGYALKWNRSFCFQTIFTVITYQSIFQLMPSQFPPWYTLLFVCRYSSSKISFSTLNRSCFTFCIVLRVSSLPRGVGTGVWYVELGWGRLLDYWDCRFVPNLLSTVPPLILRKSTGFSYS